MLNPTSCNEDNFYEKWTGRTPSLEQWRLITHSRLTKVSKFSIVVIWLSYSSNSVSKVRFSKFSIFLIRFHRKYNRSMFFNSDKFSSLRIRQWLKFNSWQMNLSKYHSKWKYETKISARWITSTSKSTISIIPGSSSFSPASSII